MTYEEMTMALEVQFKGLQNEKQIRGYTTIRDKSYVTGFILKLEGSQSVRISAGEVYFVTLNDAFSDGPYFAYEDSDKKEVLSEVIDTVKRFVSGKYLISNRKILGFTVGEELRFLDQNGNPMTKAIRAKKHKIAL